MADFLHWHLRVLRFVSLPNTASLENHLEIAMQEAVQRQEPLAGASGLEPCVSSLPHLLSLRGNRQAFTFSLSPFVRAQVLMLVLNVPHSHGLREVCQQAGKKFAESLPAPG